MLNAMPLIAVNTPFPIVTTKINDSAKLKVVNHKL